MDIHTMSARGRKPAPRWERRKEDRPGELLSAALELFVERGYSATRLEDIAQRAGVSKGTLYLYFETKEELLKAVVRQALLPAIVQGEKLVDEFPGSAADLIRTIISGWWKTIGTTPAGGIPKLMIAEAGNFPKLARFYFDEVIERGRRMFARALKKGMDSGEFRKMNLDYAVQVTLAPIVFLAIWQYSFQKMDPKRLDPQKYLDHCMSVLLEGLTQ